MSRVWRRETERGYAIIREVVSKGVEVYGDGREVPFERAYYHVDEFYSDGSRMRNSVLSWMPSLEGAKRHHRDWGYARGRGRWMLMEDQP